MVNTPYMDPMSVLLQKMVSFSNQSIHHLKVKARAFNKMCYADVWQDLLIPPHCNPIRSMYGRFTYIYHKNQPNVGKYTIHGSYGNGHMCGNVCHRLWHYWWDLEVANNSYNKLDKGNSIGPFSLYPSFSTKEMFPSYADTRPRGPLRLASFAAWISNRL